MYYILLGTFDDILFTLITSFMTFCTINSYILLHTLMELLQIVHKLSEGWTDYTLLVKGHCRYDHTAVLFFWWNLSCTKISLDSRMNWLVMVVKQHGQPHKTQDLISLKIKLNEAVVEFSLLFVVVISRRQKRVQLMRIREKDAKKRQQAGGQEGTYRRKPTPVKRYAGDLLAPVSVTQHAVCCRCWLLGFYGISYSSETNRCNKILVKLPPFLCTWLISPCLVLLRATYKVCGTDRWTQVLPLAAWALPTTPRSTWTMTPAPPRPLQLQPRSSGSEQRGRPTALWFSNFVFLTHNLTNKPSAKVLSCPYIDWGNENAAFWGEMRIEDHLFGESYNITTTTTVFLRETLQNRY